MRPLAAAAGKAYMKAASGSAQKVVLPLLLDAMEVKRKWETKVGALQLLETWSKVAPVEVALSLPEIIPIVTGCLADAKPQVAFCFRANVACQGASMISLRCDQDHVVLHQPLDTLNYRRFLKPGSVTVATQDHRALALYIDSTESVVFPK